MRFNFATAAAKAALSSAALAFASFALAPMAAAEPAVTITITNIEPQEGALLIALFDEAGWESQTPVAGTRVEVTGETMEVTLQPPAPGTYGVKMFQDLNGDNQLAFADSGAPAEPFGISNDAPSVSGPPLFVHAAFEIGADGATQTIHMRH